MMPQIVKAKIRHSGLSPHHAEGLAERLCRNVFVASLRRGKQPITVLGKSAGPVVKVRSELGVEIHRTRLTVLKVFDSVGFNSVDKPTVGHLPADVQLPALEIHVIPLQAQSLIAAATAVSHEF